MKNKKNLRNAVVAALAILAVCGSTGGTLAYLTDAERVTNHFTVGRVEIQGSEPHWDPDGDGTAGGEAENIVPCQTFAKDPCIQNIGDNDAYVYIEVEIPTADVIYTDHSGIRQNGGQRAHIELFEFDAAGKETQTLSSGTGISEVNDSWTQMYKREKDGKMVYTFCYNKILSPGETSTSLFDTVTFANIIEGQIEGQSLEIGVHFYAIQTENTGNGGETVPEQARNAYDKYIVQNTGQSGAVVNDEK